ncbi:hypothetical protein CSV86_006105 [Pseudomonas putida CSV86]|uniref:Uncharacterized protein n=1 Tax=Pseudomonas bharatica CSV86 TaxID=1005395 RepID=L1M7N0_9PSED|nr:MULTISPECIES: hypothetical protein [Pseudomonas]MDG9883604.1 hypothetical protein [Pseudomonas sp. GD04058]NNJ14845.1 hypothetical protein [Pseudomonas bharatica CSV86]
MADYLKALASNLSINGNLSSVTNKTNVASDPSAVPEGSVRGDLSAVRSGGAAAPTASEKTAQTTSESNEVKLLRERVKELQKQLAQQQKELQEAMASDQEDTIKQTRIASAQAAVAATTGQLLQANAALLAALTESGSSTSGNSVDTTA